MQIFKNIIKKILNFFGWKLIKIKRKKPISFVYQKPNLEEIKCILSSNGILHFGAHRGKEAEVYSWFNKKVLWIEANPIIYKDLNNHINSYFSQKALNLLLGNENKIVDFFISNKDASCSSIFDLSKEVKNRELWKEENVKMINKMRLKMIKFDDAVKKYKIDLNNLDHWIVDLQGAEIQFLEGAKNSLSFCKSIFVEISQKNFYDNGSSLWSDLKLFLNKNGFTNMSEPTSNHCDILFKKIKNAK